MHLFLYLALEGPKWKSWILPKVSILLETKEKESKVIARVLYFQHGLQLPRLYQVLLLSA